MLMKEQLAKMQYDSLVHEDAKSCEALLQSELYARSEWVFAFLNQEDEPNIRPLLIHALMHKKLALPVTDARSIMHFHPLSDFADLKEGRYGILEPPRTEIIKADENTLILVPAVAYSLNRERLGRGKGYYDRYLLTKN